MTPYEIFRVHRGRRSEFSFSAGTNGPLLVAVTPPTGNEICNLIENLLHDVVNLKHHRSLSYKRHR